MEANSKLRVFEVVKRIFRDGLLFIFAAFLLLVLVFVAENIQADLGSIQPDSSAAGGLSQATQNSCGGGVNNAECLNDGGATTSPPANTTGDFLTFGNGNTDRYLMTTISDAATTTEVRVHVYHHEGNGNMALFVSLLNDTESTNYGTQVQLPNRNGSGNAGWSTATFNTTNFPLDNGELAGMRVQLNCTRPGGGQPSNCTVFAMYADVTYTPQINVSVSAGGLHQDLEVGTTSAYVGGQFVIKETSGGSRDIESIAINEYGTVDAQNDIKNVELWYDIDNTGADGYNCSSESFDGNEFQYDVTDTDGFDGANGTSTFSDTGIGISSTASMCVYVLLDVEDTAAAGETLRLRINDPSANVVPSTGIVEPATPAAIGSQSTLLKTELVQTRYHWREDDGDEGGAPTGANSATNDTENSSLTLSQNSPKRLRFQIDNEGNQTSPAVQYRLEYAQDVTNCAAITGNNWIDVDAVDDDWNIYTLSGLTNGNNTTNFTGALFGALTDPGGGATFQGTNGGQVESGSQSGNVTLSSAQFTELEYAVVASTTATEGNAYCFRLITDEGGATSTLNGYTQYAEAIIAADLTVTATSTQQAYASIPDTNIDGGGFVITDSTPGDHTITSITIAASGTVDYQNHIENIELWYDIDDAAPLDCTGEAFGDAEAEVQFGTIDTDGFSVGATSTFTDAGVTVGTTETLCLYVFYDATASTSDQSTLDIKINDPASDIVLTAAGSVSPAASVPVSGVTRFGISKPTQVHYHWRNDNGGEGGSPTGGTSATSDTEDTKLSNLTKQSPIRLRLEVSNEGGTTTPAIQYRLEYAQQISTCAAATGWTDVGAGGGDFDMAPSSGLSEGSNTSNVGEAAFGAVSDENDTFQGTNGGQKVASSQTGNITLSETQFVELEYSIQATNNAVTGGNYCFRLTDAGTELADYDVYPELSIKLDTDFFVQRDFVTITGTSTTIVAGNDYTAPSQASSAFIRITNTHHTGAGANIGSTNSNADDVTVRILDPENIANSVTFARAQFPGDNTRVAYEIVEYKGSLAGVNEMIVRDQGTLTYVGASTTVTSPVVSGVSDDSDIVVFITAQYNPDSGRNNYNTVLSTAEWLSTSDRALFTRGEAGGNAVEVSYAIVEFTGSNWRVQRTAEHTYSAVGAAQTESISMISSLSRAFVHAQKRTSVDTHAGFGHQVWISTQTTVSFFLDSGAGTASNHTSVAWVVENLQPAGDVMEVIQVSGFQTGGTSPTTTNFTFGKTLDDLSVSSLFINNSGSGGARSWPEPMMAAQLVSDTEFQIWVSDSADSRSFRAEVVEWPTAQPTLTQSHYYLFASTTDLTPADAWPPGAGDIGEDAEILDVDDGPVANGQGVRVRMTLRVGAAAFSPSIDAFKLQYAPKGNDCLAATGWQAVGGKSSTTALWRGVETPNTDGEELSGLVISTADVAGTFEEENNSAVTPNIAFVGEDIEFDWAIENNGAADKTSYCFRMVYANGSELAGGYELFPTVRTVGYGPQSQDWKWFSDAENETPVSQLAATNSAPIDVALDDTMQLRMTIREVDGGTNNTAKFKLQFSEYSDFSTSTDVAEIGDCVDGESFWCYGDGGGVDNATITTRTIFDADSCSAGIGAGCGTHNESGISASEFVHGAGEATEFAFTIRQSGAQVNRVYYFRAYDVVNGEPVSTGVGEFYPSLMTEGASMTFEMFGITAPTTIDGETIDIDSTPSTINFGEVPFGTKVAAAHRLSIDSNGTEGYQILILGRDDLVSQNGNKINPITGTNASPVDWDAGCAGLAGCIGYHTTDPTLGSLPISRFSAEDTFARLSSTTPEEVVFSTSPSPGETVDVVYKLKVEQAQDPGDYEMNLIYIAIPLF